LNPIFLRAENLFVGQFGQLFIVISLFAAIVSAISYFLATRKENEISNASSWMSLGRKAYILHSISVVLVFSTLFYIISQHLFEYYYAWRHTSIGLKTKYLFAAFWEGGEGSFLLWLFWQALLGLIVLYKRDELESRTMFIIAMVQALLTTFILGYYLIDDVKIGTSPFVLLKHEMDAPIFQMENYLEKIKDGNGLNVLLQNYWMVIHPPVLFLGFATGLIPFAYAVAAVWKGDYKLFIKPIIRWTLVSAGILGLGIMMGGAWAYESLTFGGYWAWDPVENASLVPWMIMVAGLHTLLIYKSTGRSLKISLLFIALSYIFIWYSTFLTRTGVLGETSVHSFTGDGAFLYWHLIVVIAALALMLLIPMIKNWKKIPVVAGEEAASSREFWMLIGSIIFFIAALQIIFTTSLPVWASTYKKITGIDVAPPVDVVTFYNDIQVWAAFIILTFSGFSQFLKYKKTGNAVAKILTLIAGISIIIAIMLVFGQKIAHIQYMFFAFAIIFALVSNFYYFFTAQKANIKKAGGSITHLGFAIMLLGVLISGYNKTVISLDRTNTYVDFNKETYEENLKESRENVMIFRNTTLPMGEYSVTYLGDSTDTKAAPPLSYFKVRYDKRHPETGEILETFVLHPQAYKKELAANPDSRHYLTHDVFTYVNAFSEHVDENAKDSINYKTYRIAKGDSIYIANGIIVFENLTNTPQNNPNYDKNTLKNKVAAEAVLNVYDLDRKLGSVHPILLIDSNMVYTIPDTLKDLGLYVNIDQIHPEDGSVSFKLYQKGQLDDWIVLKAIIFPWVNLVWAGVIIMVLGFFITFYARRK
jgi:cytochrome c-type biogenesis protein CcmF